MVASSFRCDARDHAGSGARWTSFSDPEKISDAPVIDANRGGESSRRSGPVRAMVGQGLRRVMRSKADR